MTALTRRALLLLSLPAPLGACAEASGDPVVHRADPPERDRLFRLNPARCVSPCRYDLGAGLTRIRDDATVAADGGHQIAAHALPALQALVSAARGAGHRLRVGSAHRSYEAQLEIWKTTTEVGRAARPGHSEHQLGTAVDLAYDTSAAEGWVAQESWRFGFVLSYPQRKQRTTGFRYEPWHVRFVGPDVAREIFERGWAVEEWFQAHPERGISGDCRDCPAPESRADCAAIGAQPACVGSVLTFCREGAPWAVDCATSGLVCAPAAPDADCR